MQEKNARIIRQVLEALPERAREALLCFYVRGESADVVCREAGFTEAEFRVIKTRAKASFLALAV